jgi:hypothetical protein
MNLTEIRFYGGIFHEKRYRGREVPHRNSMVIDDHGSSSAADIPLYYSVLPEYRINKRIQIQAFLPSGDEITPNIPKNVC